MDNNDEILGGAQTQADGADIAESITSSVRSRAKSVSEIDSDSKEEQQDHQGSR